jgi:hypothetical protein
VIANEEMFRRVKEACQATLKVEINDLKSLQLEEQSLDDRQKYDDALATFEGRICI